MAARFWSNGEQQPDSMAIAHQVTRARREVAPRYFLLRTNPVLEVD
jgi:hypothetical protein